MPPTSIREPAPPASRKTGTGAERRSKKNLFQKTIFVVLAVSLAVHVLFLLAFGSKDIFKGTVPTLAFVSQEIATEVLDDTPPPPTEEGPTSVEESVVDTFPQEVPDSSAIEESAPALEMLTVVGGASWAPAISKNTPVSETGVIGGSGQGTGVTAGKGPAAPTSGKKLFGVSIQARKLGVIVSVNKGAQSSGKLPGIFAEIFKQFPDSPVFLTNGGGMMDWDKALDNFNQKVQEEKKRAKEAKRDYRGPSKMEKPKAAKFNTGEALDWVAVRGNNTVQDYPGLKEKHPDLFEDLRKRSSVWFITGYKDANACYLAFDEFIKRGVEAIYWYNSFDSPIEGKEAEEIAQKILESKIEILVQNQGTRIQGKEWLEKVEAKFIK